MPMYGSRYIFSKPFFTGWVTVGIIWIFCSFIAVVIFPAWESRETLTRVVSRMLGIKKKKSSSNVVDGEPAGADSPGAATPVRKDATVVDGEKVQSD